MPRASQPRAPWADRRAVLQPDNGLGLCAKKRRATTPGKAREEAQVPITASVRSPSGKATRHRIPTGGTLERARDNKTIRGCRGPERKGWRGRARMVFRAVKILCMIWVRYDGGYGSRCIIQTHCPSANTLCICPHAKKEPKHELRTQLTLH